MPAILHRLWIAASPGRVFSALTSPGELVQWWTTDVVQEGDCRARGGIAEFGFAGHGVVLRMLVEEADEPRRLVWRCVGGDPEWQDTLLEFDLARDAGGTRLDFAHRGWKREDGALAAWSYDWSRYLTSLSAFLATGNGEPHPRYRSLGRGRHDAAP